MNERTLAHLLGLRLVVRPGATLIGSAGLWLALVVVGLGPLALSVGEALFGALLAVGLHWFSELFHHLGHAWAARSVGHPMLGVRFGFLGLFGISLYPPDEGPLPARVHIRRAMGGPFFSALLTLALALIVWANPGGVAWLLAMFAFLENLFIFTLQALVPGKFNDGATLWRWLRRH